ncbi:MAG TPA: putative molybdenum carrier protein [Desulfobacterales bacterium]|nr:putative molybdenum carrier protein [Desulfobacterales bacterium]
MLKKIISGGQTGADQAALDVAFRLGIPYGGWIPKGRLTEEGRLDSKYKLKEMETTNYNKRTEQNVIDSDGTLIISHGKLTGGSDYTREMALLHHRPWLHIDLNKTGAFQAAGKIKSWIAENEIEVLNVAGSRASKDPSIYQDTVDIIETIFYLDLIDDTIPASFSVTPKRRAEMEKDILPKTVEEATDRLLSKLSLRDKTMIANIPRDNVMDLYNSLEENMQKEVGLWLTNKSLLKSCRSISGDKHLSEYGASLVIVKLLWEKLQKTSVLKIVR